MEPMTTIRHLTTDEYADALGVAPDKLTEWVTEGEISPAIVDQGIAWWRHEDADPQPTRSHRVINTVLALLAQLPPGLADHPALTWHVHAELVDAPLVRFSLHRATPEDQLRLALAVKAATGGRMRLIAGVQWDVEALAWRDGVAVTCTANVMEGPL